MEGGGGAIPAQGELREEHVFGIGWEKKVVYFRTRGREKRDVGVYDI